MASKTRSQKKLSEKQLSSIEREIRQNPNTTAAEVAKKANLKVSQVSCSGVWRAHLKDMSSSVVPKAPSTPNGVTIEALQIALVDAYKISQELEKRLKAESEARATAIKDLLGSEG